MFKKILIPLDGSATAEQAVAWARPYAVPDKSLVLLLQVLHAEYPLEGLPFRAGASEARRYLQGIERQLNFAGIAAKIVLHNDPVPRAIAGTARQEGCDLILMTSRGASKAVRWLIGGVTAQVVRLSTVPVLIVRGAADSRAPVRTRRILVPQDGSTHAQAVLPLACRLARFHRAPIVLLHVRRPGTPPVPPARLESLGPRLQRRGLRARLIVEEGDPAERILESCRSGDLLTMTTHGTGGLKRLLLGSIAEKVLHQATVPALLYKHRPKGRDTAVDLEAVKLFER